jgi:hypothetical protein
MATVFTAVGAAVASASAGAATFFGGAGAATAGAGAAATAGSGIVTLSQVLSAGSALAAIGQGISASRSARDQAAFANVQAVQEEAQGAAQARDLAREYAELTGEQRVIQLANGLDIGIGTPVNVAESTKRLAERNLDVTRQNASNRASMSRLRSRGLMSEARASMLAGFGGAAQIGVDAYQLTG